MKNASKITKILAIVMIVMGAIRSISVLPTLSTYEELKVLGNNVYLSAMICDVLTSVGSLVVGVISLLAVLKKKSLLAVGVVDIVACVAFFASFLFFMFSAEVSVRNQGTVLICALPALVGVNMIQMNKQLKEEAGV